MVTRVDKFLGGLSADVTNVANVHATENRIAFGHGDTNPTANVHVIGDVLATTGFVVPNDGDIGSVGATDAIQISSGGIVTFKDDIKIKDGGTIGSASDAAAITIAASGQVTFSDVATFSGGLKVPNDGDIGSADATDAIQISSAGIVTFKDDIKIKDGGTIGVASKADAITIASDGKATLVDDLAVTGNNIVTLGLGLAGNTAPALLTGAAVNPSLSLGTPANVVIRTFKASGAGNVIIGDATATSGFNLDVRGTANTGAFTATTITALTDGGVQVPNDGNIGSAGATDAIQISSGGIVTFKDDIKIKDGGTIGSATTPAAITVASDGIVTFADDIKIKDVGTIGSASATGAITIAADGAVTFSGSTASFDTTPGTTGLTTYYETDTGLATIASHSSGGSTQLVFHTNSSAGATVEAMRIGSDGDLTLAQDLELQHDGAIISFGTNDEITLTHVHDAGLLLNDAGGSVSLQLHDASEAVSSDGSKLILTSNGVAFDMPTADGNADQALVTDGSGALSFATVLTSSDPSTTLAATPDLGSVASGGSQDAFGQNLGGLTETDLLDEPTGSLSTLDAGALS